MEQCKACQLCIVNPVCDDAISLYSEPCMKVMEAFDKLGLKGSGEHISQQTKPTCPNLWHDNFHDGCGICPDCGEEF